MMLRSFFCLTILILIIMSLLIAVSQWLGHILSGDVFLYLTVLDDEERNVLINAFDTGTGVTQSLLKAPEVLEFSVSPDGQFLLYARRENHETALYRYKILSPKPDLLLTGNIDTARWSPDGQWIAFRNNQGRERGLYVMSVNNAEIRRITSQAYGVYSWSSDSQNLIYATTHQIDYGIFSVSIADNQSELLTTFEGYMTGINGFPILAVISTIPQHYNFISGKSGILSEPMIFSGHPTWSDDNERWAYISASFDREDWLLNIYSVEGELLARYQAQGLEPSNSLVWWLSG